MCLLLIGGCSEVPKITDTKPIPIPMFPDEPLGEFQQAMLDAINDARAIPRVCGNLIFPSAGPLKWSHRLEQAAIRHSTDMSNNIFLEHIGSDGTNAGDRIDDTGYDWIAWAENIAFGFATINGVVEGWLKSPNHCLNIMNPNYKDIGMAEIGSYWTQLFAAPVYVPTSGI